MRRFVLVVLASCGQPHLVGVPDDQPCATPDAIPSGPSSIELSTGAIQDTVIYSNPTDDDLEFNFGDHSALYVGHTNAGYIDWHSLIRLDEAQVPVGGIVSATLNLWRFPNQWSQAPGAIDVFRVSEGNDWVEGTGVGFMAPDDGAADWNHTKHSTTGWLGSPGAESPGIDYDDDEAPPSIPYDAFMDGEPQLFSAELPTEWLEEWRDGVRQNNGLLLKEHAFFGNDIFCAHSSDSRESPMFVEIATE